MKSRNLIKKEYLSKIQEIKKHNKLNKSQDKNNKIL